MTRCNLACLGDRAEKWSDSRRSSLCSVPSNTMTYWTKPMPALEQSNEVIQGVPLLEVVHCTLKVHTTFQHIGLSCSQSRVMKWLKQFWATELLSPSCLCLSWSSFTLLYVYHLWCTSTSRVEYFSAGVNIFQTVLGDGASLAFLSLSLSLLVFTLLYVWCTYTNIFSYASSSTLYPCQWVSQWVSRSFGLA